MKKKWTIKRVFKELIFTVILLFVISMVLNYIRKPDINADIYSLELIDIKNKTVNMSQYKNKPLIVHFWATWCPTCKFEASNIERVSKNHNVITIAVNSGSDKDISSYMRENNLSYTVINDNSGSLAKKFDIGAYPTTLIYDKNAELKFIEVGYTSTLGLQARLKLSN